MSRGRHWLAFQQAPDGSLAFPGQLLNVNVWEIAASLVALLRCDRSAYGAVIARGLPGARGLPVRDRFRAHRDRGVARGATDTRPSAGLAWLTARQDPEGDWGTVPDCFWTPYDATAPIVAAFAAWDRRGDPVVARAIRFTSEHQNPDGSWGDSGVPCTTSRELCTTLALLTLQAAGDRAPCDVIERGIGLSAPASAGGRPLDWRLLQVDGDRGHGQEGGRQRHRACGPRPRPDSGQGQ